MKTIFSALIAIAFVGLSACAPSASDVAKALKPITPPPPADNKLIEKIKPQDVRVHVANEEFAMGVGYASIFKYQDGAVRYNIDLSKGNIVNCQKGFDFDSGGMVNLNFPTGKDVVSGFDFTVQFSGFTSLATKYVIGDKIVKIEKVDSQEIIGSVYAKDENGAEVNGKFKAQICSSDL